ncbi:hypothetical protein [Variovorax sp. IB41]|uniref:hypothetical protein n=1 Tax=Variovorax sp. IB41 TaxID=2779370 RepID=UPI0018E8D5C0|nr:hypothetical protein [Variovorax sp. IB41]MBJ2156863.1 hypothetical protein [Variovorax sp. IB41]
MKQSELDKKINAYLKQEGKALGWKTKGSSAFRVEGKMFFSLLVSGSAKEDVLYRRLSCKPMAFDLELWRILGMTANLQAPLGLRTDGAYTLYGVSLNEGSIATPKWSEEGLLNASRGCLVEAEACIKSNHHLRSDDAFMELGEAFNLCILKSVPNTAWNFWKERLIHHVLKGERDQAMSIAEDRIAARDSGGFIVGGQTFYQLSQRQLKGHAASVG